MRAAACEGALPRRLAGLALAGRPALASLTGWSQDAALEEWGPPGRASRTTGEGESPQREPVVPFPARNEEQP